VALWAHLKIPEGSHGGCRNRSLGSEGSAPPSMGSHSRDIRMGLGYDWQRCADPCGARTLGSIVLIFSHPSLSHPEATVRTCFAGQSSRHLERRWPWPRDFCLKGLSVLVIVLVPGETTYVPDENRLAIFCSGSIGGRARRSLRPTETTLRLWLAGGRASLALEGTALTYLFRALLLRRGAWGVETAVPLCPDQTRRFTCEINARVRRA